MGATMGRLAADTDSSAAKSVPSGCISDVINREFGLEDGLSMKAASFDGPLLLFWFWLHDWFLSVIFKTRVAC